MHQRIEVLKRLLPVGAVALGLAACGSFGASAPPAAPPAVVDRVPVQAEPFSAERAWAHLVTLSELGPRPTGSTANREALEYIRTRLEDLELEVLDIEFTDDDPAAASEEPATAEGEEAESADEGEASDVAEAADAPASGRPPVHHLIARIPGASADSIVLMAHYDTRAGSPGANDGAPGPAVLLELARQLVERPLPYTVELVFLDGDMASDVTDDTTPLLEGSRLLADYLREAGTFDLVRLAVVYRQVGDVDLTVGRDLHSHRMHRDVFFEVAEKLGQGASFPRDRGFVESVSSHRAFAEAGMPRIVVLHDPWYGGDEPPGEYWGGEHDNRDHCSPQSLHTVGVVSLASLRRISTRLEKIDLVSGRAERRLREASEPPRITGEAVEEFGASEAPEEPSGEAEAAPEVQPSGDTPAEAGPVAAGESS